MQDKQKRNLIITIVILIIINITTLTLLWMGKPRADHMPIKDGDKNDTHRIEQLLKDQLAFSDKQVQEFLKLRGEHKNKIDKINEDLMNIKKQMFESVMYGNNEQVSDSLLNLLLTKQAEFEKVTIEHFLKVKKICTEEQKEKFFELLQRLLGPPQQGPPQRGPRGEFRNDMPPPPRSGKRPPKMN